MSHPVHRSETGPGQRRRQDAPPAANHRSPLRQKLRRAWHHLRLRLRPRSLELVYSSTYKLEIGGLPIDTDRAEKILTFLDLEGLLMRDRLLRPKRASLADLRRVHDDGYLDSLRHAESLTPIVGIEVWDELHQRALAAQRSAVGGTVLAARRALERHGTTVNLGGGFHHATPDTGRGFCIFNDVAVAIALARAGGFDRPVLVVDLDLHDGNGTRRAFADDQTVFTFSIHNQSWDEEPATASLSIELGDDVEDETYLAAVREHLPRLLEEHRPGLVFYLAGTDPAFDDRLGNWKISAAGLLARDRYVLSRMRRHGRRIPTVMLLAGGYGHLTWRYSARTLAWLMADRRDLPIPSNEEITYVRYRGLVADLEGEAQSRKKPEDDLWELTDEDILGGLGAEARPTRLLGHFSRHHIELVLERTGFLESLRGMGFPHPTMALDLDNPSGQTIRVFSDSDRDELLMELRLRLDRRSLSGRHLVKLEWLLLQNPRLPFDAQQTALPGQSHPGLGLLNDVIALLLLMCRDMELDGIAFVPSHYHLAAKGKKYLRFLEPADEAWFQAVERAVDGLPLAQATQAVAAGRLVDERSAEPVAWRPMLMVIPTSTALRERLEAAEYAREVKRTGEGLAFGLVPEKAGSATTGPAAPAAPE